MTRGYDFDTTLHSTGGCTPVEAAGQLADPAEVGWTTPQSEQAGFPARPSLQSGLLSWPAARAAAVEAPPGESTPDC